jgi:dihydropyrimidinase
MQITGWPVLTMVRGKIVAKEGEIVGAKGDGVYLVRETPSPRPQAPL